MAVKVLLDDLTREKKVFRFRWDAVEKRPARGRVYIRAKRGDALTTSPRCFDFLPIF